MTVAGCRSPPLFLVKLNKMDIQSVADIIHKMAEGFQGACVSCMHENAGRIRNLILEQLIAGQDSEGRHLTPTYDNDPFFEEEGFWHHRNASYKAWKRTITPQITGGQVLGLDPRPDEVPNLYIDGTFYGQIDVSGMPEGLNVDAGTGNGPAIVGKYDEAGHNILGLGPSSKEYFLREFMIPCIDRFFKSCGYR